MFIEEIHKLKPVNAKIEWLLKIILLGLLLLIPITGCAQDSTIVYTVKPGDSLTKIAASFNSPDSWNSIFEANRDDIQNPDVIYTGQKLHIPYFIAKSENSHFATTKKPPKSGDTFQAKKTSKTEEDPTMLEKFRQAFQQVAKQEPENKEKQNTTDYNLDIGGLIINETRSKMGSDFYNVFYKHWSAPENAGNFILTITEQPMPSMGAFVTVKIDNQQVFKTRLQPRYAITEKLAKQAVAVTYHTLYEQLSISSQITTY